MRIYLTVSVDYLEISENELVGFKVFSFGELYVKYQISITDETKYANRQKYLAKEISLLNENIIIIENPCYDLKDIAVLIGELNKYNKSITRIYIPSEERINIRIQNAIDEQRKWGYREGISDEEIERNFAVFKETMNGIKDGLQNTSIKVIEV